MGRRGASRNPTEPDGTPLNAQNEGITPTDPPFPAFPEFPVSDIPTSTPAFPIPNISVVSKRWVFGVGKKLDQPEGNMGNTGIRALGGTRRPPYGGVTPHIRQFPAFQPTSASPIPPRPAHSPIPNVSAVSKRRSLLGGPDVWGGRRGSGKNGPLRTSRNLAKPHGTPKRANYDLKSIKFPALLSISRLAFPHFAPPSPPIPHYPAFRWFRNAMSGLAGGMYEATVGGDGKNGPLRNQAEPHGT